MCTVVSFLARCAISSLEARTSVYLVLHISAPPYLAFRAFICPHLLASATKRRDGLSRKASRTERFERGKILPFSYRITCYPRSNACP